jgi:hypothetical protein
MEAMYVSIEVLTTLGSFAGLLVAIVAGFGWTIRRTDAQLQHATGRLEARMDRIESRMDRLEGQTAALTHELTDVKITIARLEGPPPRLYTTR